VRTPSGVECALYYEDHYRGKEQRVCRARRGDRSLRWRPTDCATCPVPGILLRNGSPFLQLTLTTTREGLLRRRATSVEAWCTRHALPIADPIVGCPECLRLDGEPDLDAR
jgi:hypothetical protein